MPRIDPLKLLVCLSVLLAPNGGIRSANEVKRLANLMAKFSKKLVSKCIYIQILKCTETELLGQFMAAGGWSLVHMWLGDGITTKNWPLIQELLELLLCCPVDVERLKSNTAPKLVKTLSKDSTHEGVRLLASKLVEQWLKIARNDIRAGNQQPQSSSQSPSLAAQPSISDDKSPNPEQHQEHQITLQEEVLDGPHEEVLDETVMEEEEEIVPDVDPLATTSAEQIENGLVEGDSEEKPEEDVEETKKAFNDAVTESSNKKTPLLFKITMKNGKQVLAKVESPSKKSASSVVDDEEESEKVEEDGSKDEVKDETVADRDTTITEESVAEVEETDSTDSANKSYSGNAVKDDKKDKSDVDKEKNKDRRKSSDKERSKDSKDKSSSKDKDRHRDKDRDKKSSSSGHRSSSSKSSSTSSSSKHNSSSSSSKSKSSSTSSSSKSSSSSSSSKDKDKDKHNSSSSSKHHHKSSSSTKSSSSSSKSSSSSSDKHREHKDKDKSSNSIKDNDPKLSSPTSSKLDRTSKKSKESGDERAAGTSEDNKQSPVHSNKKASISIEVRNAEHRPKTVKTFNSQFRSHGLIEEAPPPPSRKGLKKPAVTTPAAVIGSTATGTVHSHSKRSSPPPSSKEGPPEKKAREEPAERPGAIKLIPPKRQPSLIESDMFMDALSATLKKDVKKRKRKLSGSEAGKAHDAKTSATPPTPTTPTSEKAPTIAKAASPEKSVLPSPPMSPTHAEKTVCPAASPAIVAAPGSPNATEPSSPTKVVAAPMSFYRDTLADSEETAEDKKEHAEEQVPELAEPTDEKPDVKTEAIPDTPAEPDEEDEEVIKKPKRLKSELIDDDEGDDKAGLIDAVGNDVAKKMEEELPVQKVPGPGCGPNGPPGVLVIHRRKGPKKQLKWKVQEELEEIRYFELDVTERCNVTRTFTDLKHMERVDERNKYMLARKVNVDDMMMERTPWMPMIVIDNVPPHPDGVNSQERRIQQNRERTVLQALYFNRHMIPDSPAEPDVEVYSISEPTHIPMDDVTGNPDSVNDFTSMPWPEPKSTPPHESAGFNSPFFPGAGNDFPPFGNNANWDLPGVNPGPMPGMFPPGRMGPPMGGNNGSPGGPPMMRPMNMPHNMGSNMGGPPHPNMFQDNFVRGPHPMQHMNDRDDENFRNGPPPPPAWFGGNNNGGGMNRGPPPPHQGNFNNRGGGSGRDFDRGGNDRFGGGGGARRGDGGNWNNRDHDRGGPRGGNYRPPWLSNNRGNQSGHRGGGRKW